MSEKIVQLNEEVIKVQLKELVRGVEEALIEMYLAGVSARRVEDITEALRGSKKYMNMKQVVLKRLLKQENSTLNRQI